MPELIDQIVFEWPMLAFALPLPWLIRVLLPPASEAQEAALWVPTLDDFQAVASASRRPSILKHLLATFIWLLAVLGAMRPVWLGEPVALPMSGRDLMLAVDLSKSMQQVDFSLRGQMIDRLTAAKLVARNFIAEREGDRIGLIVFADQAYLQAPLTLDRTTVTTLLDETAIGLAGRQTAIGDAIGLAVKRLADPETGRLDANEDRVLILMTDGANTAGEIEPLIAADLAADAGLKIHTIGLGADVQVVQTLFGNRRINPSLDLDEETLTAIAEKTGGRYFRARDTGELVGIYEEIDRLEPVLGDPDYFRPRREFFVYPLAAALALAALGVAATLLGRLSGRGVGGPPRADVADAAKGAAFRPRQT